MSLFFLFFLFSSRFQAAVISFIHDMNCLLLCRASNIRTLWNVFHVTRDYHTTRKRSVNISHAVPKGTQMGGSNFWLSIKSIWNTLSCCCFVCAFIIGQYHSGNNMSSKSEAAREILFFESEKHHEIRPLKTDTLTVSTFNAFVHVHDESKHYLSHRFAQRRYRFTQFI